VSALRVGWLERRNDSPWQRLLLAPLELAGLVYGAFAACHRWLYARGWRRRRRLACRVLSLGSPTVGGSGKTPLAAWIAAGLRRRGHTVVRASRGYGRPSRASRGYGRRSREGVVVVSDGRHVWSPASAAGDEPLLLAAHAPGVPVLVGRDRGLVGLRAIAAFGAEILVLDDGFHHHRLARDLEVVLLDGRFGLGNGRVLPRGPLREPARALRVAQAIGVIDGPLPDPDEARIQALAPGAFRFSARRRPNRLVPLGGGAALPPGALSRERIGLLAGLARPDGFRRTLEELGARIEIERVFGDHHRYRPRDVADLARHATVWVTTEKDAVKIPRAWVGQADVRVLGIELEVDEPERLLDWCESRLR
jgi:tetraacyldisaccharide 4'-kinase